MASKIEPSELLCTMVRAVGLEPTLLSERDFESRASTSFTTPAGRQTEHEAHTAGAVEAYRREDGGFLDRIPVK